MPFDATRAASKADAIEQAFGEIGHTNGTRMPPHGKSATEGAAWEYHVASVLLRYAEKRRERAHKAAVAAGVLFDHLKAPLGPGTTNAPVYDGELVLITCSTVAQADRLDGPAMLAALLKAKVSPVLVRKLEADHTMTFKPAHKFTSSLVAR